MVCCRRGARLAPGFPPCPLQHPHSPAPVRVPRMTSPALQEVVALLGCPAAGNPAQYLFERAIAAAGLDWRFVTFDVQPERLAAALAGVQAMGFRGCLLSGPLQTLALPALLSLAPTASFSGAVSLIERTPEGRAGHMTQGRGLAAALRGHTDLTGARVLLAGAGATGRAAALELALAGALEVLVCDPDPARAAALVEAIGALNSSALPALVPWQTAVEIPERVGIVVSALPVEGSTIACSFSGLRNSVVVADCTLVGQPSAAVAAGLKAGACVIDGLEIHCEKTAIDFQTLTGSETDIEMLHEALDEFLSA